MLYANGQTELYDMLRDPAQQLSKHADPRYRFIRKFLFGQLVQLANCRAAICRAEAGTDPVPVPKKKVKAKSKK